MILTDTHHIVIGGPPYDGRCECCSRHWSECNPPHLRQDFRGDECISKYWVCEACFVLPDGKFFDLMIMDKTEWGLAPWLEKFWKLVPNATAPLEFYMARKSPEEAAELSEPRVEFNYRNLPEAF